LRPNGRKKLKRTIEITARQRKTGKEKKTTTMVVECGRGTGMLEKKAAKREASHGREIHKKGNKTVSKQR